MTWVVSKFLGFSIEVFDSNSFFVAHRHLGEFSVWRGRVIVFLERVVFHHTLNIIVLTSLELGRLRFGLTFQPI